MLCFSVPILYAYMYLSNLYKPHFIGTCENMGASQLLISVCSVDSWLGGLVILLFQLFPTLL